MNKLSKVAAALLLATPLAAAAEPLPKPVADLQCLVGQWKGGGSLTMGGQGAAKLQATWACKRTSAQFGVSCTLRVTGIPGVAAYEETDLMGYEPNSQTYHWYAVTNAGETHDHVAQPWAASTLQFVFTGTQEGKSLKEVIELSFAPGNKQVSGRAETFVAGASVSVMQLDLHK